MIREPRSTFVGRAPELTALARVLDAERLITLTGVGGVGKTRLAFRAAVDWGARRSASVWIVPLESVTDPGLLPLTVLRALGLNDQSMRDPTETLTESLIDAEALIVIDNCEHVIDSAARFINELLDSLPQLRILATSRRPLELVGEHLFPVPPLSLGIGPDEASDALDLLTARARSAGSPLDLSADGRRAAVELCRALDGLPLAIELAATRMRTMTVHDLNERLSARFSLLQNGPRNAVQRQRTLRAMVDCRLPSPSRTSLAPRRWTRWTSSSRSPSSSQTTNPHGSACWRRCASTGASARRNQDHGTGSSAATSTTCV